MEKLKKNTSLSFKEFSKLVSSIILTENGNCPVTPVISMISCNDGFRPVSFLIETLDEEKG